MHAGRKEPWRETIAQFARFDGLVAEIDDALTWGLDLTDETVVVGSESDPTEERFLRSYWTPWLDLVDVETLHCPAHDPERATAIARLALCSVLAAPLHLLDLGAEDFLDSYTEVRAAMREIVAVTDGTPSVRSTFTVDGIEHPALCVTIRSATAVYTTADSTALVVAGPHDLVEQLTIVMRPSHPLLHGGDA